MHDTMLKSVVIWFGMAWLITSSCTDFREAANEEYHQKTNSRDDTKEEWMLETQSDDELRPETSQPQFTLTKKLKL